MIFRQVILTFILLFALMLIPLSASASTHSVQRPCDLEQSFFGIPTWYKYLHTEIDATGRCSPTIGSEDGILSINGILPIGLAVLEGMLRFAGIVAVVMIFISSFRYITSQGNAESAAAARKTAINALIGLAIVILSTALVAFIGNGITGG